MNLMTELQYELLVSWVPLSKLIRACQKQALLGKAAAGQVAFLVQMSSEPNANGRSETQSAASSGVVVA